jgi:hypothetical protein
VSDLAEPGAEAAIAQAAAPVVDASLAEMIPDPVVADVAPVVEPTLRELVLDAVVADAVAPDVDAPLGELVPDAVVADTVAPVVDVERTERVAGASVEAACAALSAPVPTDLPVAPLSRSPLVEDPDGGPALDPGTVPSPASSGPVSVPVPPVEPASVMASVPAPARIVAPREIRALFSRLSRLAIDADEAHGVTVYRVCSGDVASDAVGDLAVCLLPFLRDGWSGAAVGQITLRGARGAVVVSALGDLRADGALLAVAAGRGSSLALLELLGRRAAAEWTGRGSAPSRAGAGRGDVDRVTGGGLVAEAPGPDIARVARTLAAFGEVSAARFGSGTAVRIDAFVDAGLGVSAVAGFARDLVDAVAATPAAGELGRLESVTCRRGDEHLVARPLLSAVVGSCGHDRLVVAAGVVARPGLAQGQLERVAAVLAGEAG